jgi:CHAD domain-containing protein
MVTSSNVIKSADDGPRVRPDLFGGLPGVVEVVGPDRQSWDATFYDSADMRLAHAGITVCRGEGGQDEGWHATLPVNARRQREVHMPLGRSPGAVPHELTNLVSAYTTDRPLRRCAHVRTERAVWRLVDDEGNLLAEVADDTVRSQELGDREGPVRTWQEVDVQLGDGDTDLLASVRERLADAGVTPSTVENTLGRARGDLSVPAAPRLGGRSSAAEVLTAYLRTQVDRLRRGDVAVRLEEPAGVHDLRVAVRRISSVLRVFRPILVASRVQPLARELKWISDLLGAARDVEVLGAALGGTLSAIPTELVLGPVPAHVDRYLAKPRAEAAGALRTAMSHRRYRQLLDLLDTLLTDPPYQATADRRARKVLPPLVAKAYRKARKAARSARRMTPGSDQDAALHLVRRRAKRLRYAIETVEPVVGKRARRLRRRTKDVQGLLGDHHDLVVLRPVLRELGARAHQDGGNGFTFGLVYGSADERARRMAQRFPRRWRRVARRRRTRWLRD